MHSAPFSNLFLFKPFHTFTQAILTSNLNTVTHTDGRHSKLSACNQFLFFLYIVRPFHKSFFFSQRPLASGPLTFPRTLDGVLLFFPSFLTTSQLFGHVFFFLFLFPRSFLPIRLMSATPAASVKSHKSPASGAATSSEAQREPAASSLHTRQLSPPSSNKCSIQMRRRCRGRGRGKLICR